MTRLIVAALAGIPALIALADVEVTGVDGDVKQNVLAHLTLDDEPCDLADHKIEYRFAQAPAEIRRALEPLGYYRAEVESALGHRDNGCWHATFHLTLNEPVLIATSRIAVRGPGAGFPPFRTVLAKSGLDVGARLNHAAFDSTKTRLLATAREYGFFEATLVLHEVRVDVEANRADVALVLETGPRYTFGTIEIDSHLDPGFVQRYVGFSGGGPFEQRWVTQLHNDLIASDYFQDVTVERTLHEDERTVDLALKLAEARRRRYGVGLGYGTDTGPVVSGDFVNRWVNRRGHRLELGARLSPVESNGTFNYRIPGDEPQRDWYSLYGGVSSKRTDAVGDDSWKLGVREIRYHTRRWRSNRFLEDVYDRFRQDSQTKRQNTLVPGYTLTYLYANATERPTAGLRFSVEVLGASQSVLSDVSFGRLRLDGKVILPLFARGRLLARGETGWMATDEFDDVPPTWRFFAGGDTSVRGYGYQSLGPVDVNGERIGGRRIVTGSVELDWRVRSRWSAAMFVDAGNTGQDNLLENLPWSVGLGARWYSPVGPIRLDLAFPFEGDDTFRLHVSLGPDL